MAHRDEIDKFLFDLVGVLPGCCSSIESVKYAIARAVAEALWPKKDLALTWQDIAKIDDMLREVENCIACIDLPTMGREEYYEEVLRRYNELKNESKKKRNG